jgi:hypothetical protein
MDTAKKYAQVQTTVAKNKKAKEKKLAKAESEKKDKKSTGKVKRERYTWSDAGTSQLRGLRGRKAPAKIELMEVGSEDWYAAYPASVSLSLPLCILKTNSFVFVFLFAQSFGTQLKSWEDFQITNMARLFSPSTRLDRSRELVQADQVAAMAALKAENEGKRHGETKHQIVDIKKYQKKILPKIEDETQFGVGLLK